jgi:hypothetical protein
MQLELRIPAQKIGAVAALGSLIVTYVALAALQYWSAHLSNIADETHLRRATWLDPGNAEYCYRLGRYELLTQLSPQAALASFRSLAESKFAPGIGLTFPSPLRPWETPMLQRTRSIVASSLVRTL